jgi:hypothetical protein
MTPNFAFLQQQNSFRRCENEMTPNFAFLQQQKKTHLGFLLQLS